MADRVSQLPGNSPVPGVDDYLDFLTNVLGFSTDPTQYPMLDVADTLASVAFSFNDFFEFGNPTNTTRFLGYIDLCPPGSTLCDNIHGPFVMSVASAYNDSKIDPVNLDLRRISQGLGCVPVRTDLEYDHLPSPKALFVVAALVAVGSVDSGIFPSTNTLCSARGSQTTVGAIARLLSVLAATLGHTTTSPDF